ncbi:MAG: hypothetical protein JXB13_06035 [Phycisphaerae bacterium]|nr:hypothetical protein [Phycisphaerae bacterium]
MNRTRHARTWVVVLAASVFAVVLALTACQVNVSPGGNGGAQVEFKIVGMTFTVELGNAGVLDVTTPGEPVRNAISVQLFSETPTDVPADADFIVEAEDVQLLSLASSGQKSFSASQAATDGTRAQVRAYVALGTSEDPCANGSLAMEFELRQENGRTVMYQNGQPVDVRAMFRLGASKLNLIRWGVFSLCLEVSSDDGQTRVVINSFGVKYLDQEEPDNGNANDNDNANANDNQNANDNENDNTSDNVNDNVDDNDNGEPVNPLDPDGDGDFDAQTCDGWDWVEVSAEDPPRYEGSPGNVACLAKIHFKNNGSGNVVIWWHVTKEVPATGTVTEDGWYSTGLGPGQERDSVESAWIYSSENNTLLHVVTSEVMVSRYDNEYERGCQWLSGAIREDDSTVELYRIDVTGLNPCE